MHSFKGDIPGFDIKEIHKYLKKVDGWNVLKNDKNNYYIEKDFKFKNFIDSEKFIIEVGKIAETEGHHPDINFGWGYAKIKISTHAIVFIQFKPDIVDKLTRNKSYSS